MGHTFVAGEVLTAANVQEYLNPGTRFVQQGSNQVINNSTTLTNSTGLVLTGAQTLNASTIYRFVAYIIASSITTTPDMKVNFTFGGTATFHWTPMGISDLSATADSTIRTVDHTSTGSFRSIGLLTFDCVTLVHGYVNTGASSGDLTFQWAQNTATAENTSVKAGSWLHAWPVG
jgi:hypothetical protein